MKFFPQITKQNRGYRLLILLIAADMAFILLHLVHKFTLLLPDTRFSITRDGGYSEFYQYIKELWIIVLLVSLAIKRGRLLYAGYGGLFIYFLADDFFQIHETAGNSLANYLQIPSKFGLRPQDFGELVVFAFFGLLFVLLIGLSHYFSDPETRKFSRQMFVLVILLAVFGIIFDMLEMGSSQPFLGLLLGIFDDGGEMLVMSLITAFVYSVSLPTPASQDPALA